MMKCNEIQEKISLYIDNKLSLQEMNFIKEHIEKCDICKKEYIAIKNVKVLLQKLPKSQPSEMFTANVMNEIKKISIEKKDNVFSFDLLKKHFVMAAGFVFIVLSTSLFFMNFDGNKSIKNQNITDNSIIEYYLASNDYSIDDDNDDYEQYVLSLLC